MNTVSSHVLDAVAGLPAEGVHLALYRAEGTEPIRSGRTDADGRIAGWETTPGDHRLVFGTGAWFAARGTASFYPEVVIAFSVAEADRHYHVPLLLSPFAYSTYRGS